MLDKVDLDTPGLRVATLDSRRVGHLTSKRLFVKCRNFMSFRVKWDDGRSHWYSPSCLKREDDA